ncbi:MAG: 50S ribosomal protein L21 [Thermoleophilia bacterium]
MTKSDIAYAIIRVGGQQFKVSTGDTIVVDRVDAEEGASVTYETLAVRTGTGDYEGAAQGTVTATVAGHLLGEKIKVFTYKPKSTFKKTKGHRSRLSKLKIDTIAIAESKEA